uniref:Uncharacterized protein n=1 Tax=Arundo donax TaxID=35708 RepID=A0A0A9H8F5_ARUDO
MDTSTCSHTNLSSHCTDHCHH